VCHIRCLSFGSSSVSGKQVSELGNQKGLELALKMFSWSGSKLNLDLAWGQYLSISVLLLQY
jgi:hypothetical protein